MYCLNNYEQSYTITVEWWWNR